MTIFVPTHADRKHALVILAGILLVVFGVAYVPLIKPWWQVESTRWALRASILDTQRVRSRAPRIEADIAAIRAQRLTAGLYLPEPSKALADAALSQRLQQAVTDASSVDSVCVMGNRVPMTEQARGRGKENACDEVRVQVSMQCGLTAMEGVLRELETNSPRLRIDKLELGMAPNALGLDQPLAENQALAVNFEVIGCLLPAVLATGDVVTGRG